MCKASSVSSILLQLAYVFMYIKCMTKSISKPVVVEHSTPAIQKRKASFALLLSKVEVPKSTYNDFNNFMKRAKLLKLKSWNVYFTNNEDVLFFN